MKKIISVFALAALVSVAAFAQTNAKGDRKIQKEEWREKVRAEQVAMITSELNLTEAEAQSFWPVYNDVQNKRREAYASSFKAMKALREAVENNSPDTKKLLDEYLNSRKALDVVEESAVVSYKRVLPIEKVAKLVLTQEKFRQSQIGKMGGQHPGQGGPGFGHGHGPGKAFPQAEPGVELREM